MIIPHQQLSSEALRGLIEDYITREGTDYGLHEFSLAQKVQQVERQIVRDEVVVVFDMASESASLLTRQDAQMLVQQGNRD